MRARHCGTGNITKSSTNDSGPHRRFQRIGPRDGPCTNKLDLNAPWLKAGDAKVAWAGKLMHVGICMSLNGSSAPSVQHRMEQAQETYRKRHNLLCCPYITLDRRMEAVWRSKMWRAPAWHPTRDLQEQLTTMGGGEQKKVADTAIFRKKKRGKQLQQNGGKKGIKKDISVCTDHMVDEQCGPSLLQF